MRIEATLAILPAMVVAAVLGTSAAIAQSDTAADYRRTADALIVRLTEAGGEIDASEGHPSIEIYGDGRVVVRRPAYLKNPGEHVFRLGTGELDALIASIAAKGVPAFDADGSRAAKRAALQSRLAARGTGQPVSVRGTVGAPTTVLEVHLESYRAPGAPAASRVDHTISWYGVQSDAEQYPAIESIRNLAAAREELLALMRRVDAGATP